MGRFWKFSVMLLFCFVLSGCQASAPQTPRLVTRIHISGVHQDAPVEVNYTQPQKMETVLYYLRSLEDLGKADTDPERIIGDRFKITVFYSDGSCQIYRQQADRFLSRNDRPWQLVDPRKAALLYPLLTSIPPDQPSAVRAA